MYRAHYRLVPGGGADAADLECERCGDRIHVDGSPTLAALTLLASDHDTRYHFAASYAERFGGDKDQLRPPTALGQFSD